MFLLFKLYINRKLVAKALQCVKYSTFLFFIFVGQDGETEFSAGRYIYPFTFNLPNEIPPSLIQPYGDIKYFIEAIINRPWAFDYKDKRSFTVHSYIDLNSLPDLRNPYHISMAKKPFSFFDDSGLITLSIQLPVTGYVPTQVVAFTVKIKNDSSIDVYGVQFKVVQGFIFHSDAKQSKMLKTVKGPKFEVVDSSVTPGNEKSWDLELQVPQEMITKNLQYCSIINMFAELKGKVLLPLTHRDMKIAVPITVGSVASK